MAIDLGVMAGAFVLAYLLRLDFEVQPAHWRVMAEQLPLVLFVQLTALYFTGALAFVWKYVGMTDVGTFVRAIASSTAVLVGLRVLLPGSVNLRIGLSILLLNGLTALAGLLGVRVLRRAAAERKLRQRRHSNGGGRRESVLLIGAGAAGLTAVREIRNRGDAEIDPRGFVDDDPDKQGAVIGGLKVLGTTQDLATLVPRMKIDSVAITIADAPLARLRRILEICEAVPVRARMMPSIYEILQGSVEISRFREVRVEDLLARDEVSLDEHGLERLLRGRVVMVTGAGGSIGSELARQVARCQPARLLLVDRSEPALFASDHALREERPGCVVVPLIGDVGDRARMQAVFAEHRPQIVAHAAAHKHVPLMETNASEAVKNNVVGTLTLGEVAGQHGAEAFILISTDKAVRPTSVMGATKRVAELVVQDLGRRFATRYVAVRFGNVLGSAGSVIPIFREQIAKGGPVTVTHPDMKRYFMTIPEAAVLTLQAGALGRGGEIFVLDMGEPVRIVDLAQRMIRLSSRSDEVEIVFTGMRPGEKLFEELQYGAESMDRTRHPKIFIGRIAGVPASVLHDAIATLRELARSGEASEIRQFLNAFLPEAQLAPVTEEPGELADEGELVEPETTAAARAIALVEVV